MLTTKDVQALGGHAGVYALRAALHGGVQGMAAGGAVGALSAERERWRQEIEARTYHRDLAKSRGDDTAEQFWSSWLADAQSSYDAALQAEKMAVTASRGGYAGSVTSLSSAQSLVDQVRSASQDASLGTDQRQSLSGQALAAEASYSKLYGTLTHVTDQLDAAKAKASDLQQISDRTANALAGGFGLSDAVKGGGTTTNRWRETYAIPTGKAGILTQASAYASKVKALGGKITKLVAKGFSAAIVSEVGAAGVEGGTVMADALLSMSAAEVKRLNGDYAAISTYSAQAGQAVTTAYSKGGLSAANAQVGALTAQQAKVQASITAVSKQLENLLLGAYGVPARAKGGPVWAGQPFLVGERGPELFTPQQSGYVLPADATRRLAATGAGAGQAVQVTLDRGALAQAMAGTTLTLSIDGQPVHAVIDARIGTHEAAADRASAYL
jgi:hypothetical protein